MSDRPLSAENHTPMPSQSDRDEAFEGLKAADMRGDTQVPIKWALTFLDAYLHTGLKLKALDENT